MGLPQKVLNNWSRPTGKNYRSNPKLISLTKPSKMKKMKYGCALGHTDSYSAPLLNSARIVVTNGLFQGVAMVSEWDGLRVETGLHILWVPSSSDL